MPNYLRKKIASVVNFLHSQRQAVFLVGIFSFLGVIFLFGWSHPAAAQVEELAKPGFWTGLISGILLSISRLFLSITLFILTFVIQIAGYNGYLTSSAVSVGWVMVRDITNMLFVVILLIIAFGTILGIEQYEWKKLLGKFVLAAILVNFSRIICGVIIDIAQVVMVTFVNGIAATAGGNLINAFSLDKIRDLSTNSTPTTFTDSNFLLAAIGAVFFSAIVMATLGVFMVMLLARLLVLWVLIVLSPLAFVLSVIPNTQKYASQWWSEFGSNVVTGPALLFFVWLAFVTVGNGRINDEIALNSSVPAASKIGAGGQGTSEAEQISGGQNSGISKAMEWNNMANFAIAIGMLMVGAKVASQLGGVGASLAQKAVDFGTKAGMALTGITAARFVGRKGLEAGKAAGKFALMKAPIVGGEAWQRRGRTIAAIGKIGLGKISEVRTKGAKYFEKSGKRVTELKAQRREGKISEAEFKATIDRKSVV